MRFGLFLVAHTPFALYFSFAVKRNDQSECLRANSENLLILFPDYKLPYVSRTQNQSIPNGCELNAVVLGRAEREKMYERSEFRVAFAFS